MTGDITDKGLRRILFALRAIGAVAVFIATDRFGFVVIIPMTVFAFTVALGLAVQDLLKETAP